MTPCDSLALSRYLDGDLSLPGRRELEQHLRTCTACREELSTLRRMDRVVSAWGARRQPLPAGAEARILGSVGSRRRLRPIIAISRMMPAAVGSCIAAVLILMSANMGWLYQNGANLSSTSSVAHVQRIIESQSKPLQNARRASAILGQRSVVQRQVPIRNRAQLDVE